MLEELYVNILCTYLKKIRIYFNWRQKSRTTGNIFCGISYRVYIRFLLRISLRSFREFINIKSTLLYLPYME